MANKPESAAVAVGEDAAGEAAAGEAGVTVSRAPGVGVDPSVGALPTGVPAPHPVARIKPITGGSASTARRRIRWATLGWIGTTVIVHGLSAEAGHAHERAIALGFT